MHFLLYTTNPLLISVVTTNKSHITRGRKTFPDFLDYKPNHQIGHYLLFM